MQGQMEISNNTLCCGISEISGISAYRSAEEAIIDTLTNEDKWDADTQEYVRALEIPEAAHLIFTQAQRTKALTGYGFKIANYIEKNNLGTVIRTPPAKNPNSRNYIITFVWTLNEKGIERWAEFRNFEV